MSLPPLLLGLYVAASLVALLLGGLLGHARPLGVDARRVADAAERAGLGQNGFAWRVAVVVIAVASALSLLGAVATGGPLLVFALQPWLVALVTVVGGWAVARTLTRAAARHIGLGGRDAEARLLSRSALVATLLPSSLAGLLVLGSYAAAEGRYGVRIGLQLAFGAAASIAAVSCVFARTAASLIHSVEGTAHAPAAHAGGLARFVAASFGRSLLSTAGFMTSSSLAHAVLLGHGASLTGEASVSAILYPHLLVALSLVALTFGGLVVRSSEREPGAWAWTRGAAVSVLLLVAAAWSLGPSLDEALFARILPGAATFVFLGAPLCLLALLPRSPDSLGSGLGLGAAWLALALTSFVVVRWATADEPLPAPLLHSLFVACLLALLPLSQFWRHGREQAQAAGLSLGLVGGDEPRAPSADSAPPAALGRGHWLLVVVLGFEALELLPNDLRGSSYLGFGALLGAVSLAAALAASLSAAERAKRAIERLLSQPTVGSAAAPNFGEVLELCRSPRFRGFAWPLGLVVLVPTPLAWLATRAATWSAPAAVLGFTLGALLLGSLLGWLLEPREPPELSGHTALAPALAVALVTWVTASLQFL